MKILKFLTLITLVIGLLSFDKNDNYLKEDVITFAGKYSREFGTQDTVRTVIYTIKQNIINYNLQGGSVNVNYDTEKKYYSKKDNRWIGYRKDKDTYYVIFFKNIKDDEITLYKKKIASVEEGKSEPIPADDNEENHGWNTYQK